MIFVAYLAIGVTVALYQLVTGPRPLQKHTRRTLVPGGGVVERESRDVAEFIVTVLFAVLAWLPVLIWALVGVPIHDALAQRAYMRELVGNEEAWVPRDLRDEVERRRAAKA